MRTLTSNASTILSQATGNESIIIVDIEWNEGTWTRYATKDWQGIPGKLVTVPAIDQTAASGGDNTSIKVKIDDRDQFVLDLMNSYDIHKRPAKMWQAFEGFDLDDLILLYVGEISSPIVWAEVDHTVSFDIISTVETYQVGFSPESGQYPNLAENLIGQQWPLCFGSPIHVPLVKATERIGGTLGTALGAADFTLPLKLQYTERLMEVINSAYTFYTNYLNFLLEDMDDPITIRDNYIEAIIGEDQTKQKMADLTDQVEQAQKVLGTYYRRYQGAQRSGDAAATNRWYQQILEQRAIRDDLVTQWEENYATYDDHKNDKWSAETELKWMRMQWNLSDRVQVHSEKLRQNYRVLEQRLFEIQRAISTQTAFSNNCYINNGERFPQNTPVTVRINGVILDVTFSGNMCSVNYMKPAYQSIPVSRTDDIEPNQFYVPSEEYQLNGHYCRLNTGYVIKVTGQKGLLCTFEEKKVTTTFDNTQQYAITGENILGTEMATDLSFLLTGDETPEQLQYIANTVPWEISQEAWRMLQGSEPDVQYLQYSGQPTGGTFRMMYGAEGGTSDDTSVLSGPIIWNIDPIPFIRGLSFLIAGDENWYLGTDPDNPKLSIEVEYLDSDDEWQPVPDDGTLHFLDRDIRFKITFHTDNWTDQEDPFPAVMHAIQIDSSRLSQDRSVALACYRGTTDGAQEYTIQERTARINNVIQESRDGASLIQIKEKIRRLIRMASYANNAAARQTAMNDLQQEYERYYGLLRIMFQHGSALDEAQRLISDREEDIIYDSELAAYYAWYRTVVPRPDQATRDKTQVWITNEDFTSLTATSKAFPKEWAVAPDEDLYTYFQTLPNVSATVFEPGTDIELHGPFEEVYVANIIPSTVHEVYGTYVRDGSNYLAPIPHQDMVWNGSNPFGYLNCTTVSFYRQPEDFTPDNFFAILTSSVGPNAVDIIQWIAENWTTLTVDAASFSATHTKVANYPCHFALKEPKEALQLIRDIAWQSRCETYIRNDVLFIRYMSEEPASTVDTIDQSDVIEGSYTLSYTGTEDLVTKFVGSWTATENQNDAHRLVVRTNLIKYGEREQQNDFFIYNMHGLVKKSLTFWAIYSANTWKVVNIQVPVTKLALENMDIVTLDLPYVSDNPVKAKIISYNYDPDTHQIRLTLWVPIVAGAMDTYKYAYPSSMSADFSYPTEEEVTFGFAGHPQNIKVPNTNINLVLSDNRPQDLGEYEADENETVPGNPAGELDTYSLAQLPQNAQNPQGGGAGNLINNQPLAPPATIPPTDNSIQTDASEVQTIVIPPGQIRVGRILGKSADISGYDTAIQGDDPLYYSYWAVQLLTGEVVDALAADFEESDVLPNGFLVQVTYNPWGEGDYELLIPVEIGEDPEEDEEEQA